MRKYLKRIVIFLLIITLNIDSMVLVNAQESEEWYDIELMGIDDYFDEVNSQINARGRYISSITTRIVDMGDGEVRMRVDVICCEDMIEITTIFYLQKVVNDTWVNVGTTTATFENTCDVGQTAVSYGVTAGTYRAKTVTKVTHPSGQSETATCYTGAIDIE